MSGPKEKSTKKAGNTNPHVTRSSNDNSKRQHSTPASKKAESKIPKLNLDSMDESFGINNDMSAENYVDQDEQLKCQILQSVTDLVPKILPDIITAVIPKVIEQIMPMIMKSVEAQMKDMIEVQIENRTAIRHAKVCGDIDDIRQRDKNSNLRIIGFPENDNFEDFIVNTASKLEINVSKHDFSYFRVGKMKENSPRPIIARFNNPEVKTSILRQKRNIKKDLTDRKISLFEDLTKARHIMLNVVKERYKSAHTRNGIVCFYTKDGHGGEKLIHVRNPNYLFEHGFDIDEVSKCERALMA